MRTLRKQRGQRAKRIALFAFMTASIALLAACTEKPDGESLQIVQTRGPLGTTQLSEASAEDGDPLVIVSRVSADVGRYSELTAGEGGRVERRDIMSYVVMPRDVYFAMWTRLQRLADALPKAEARAAAADDKASMRNRILNIMANTCRNDEICYSRAKPQIAKAIEAQQ